jgi:hypothetical protein
MHYMWRLLTSRKRRSMIALWTKARAPTGPSLMPIERVWLRSQKTGLRPQPQPTPSMGISSFIGKAPTDNPSIRLSTERDNGWGFYVPQGRDARTCSDSGVLRALQELPRNPDEHVTVEAHRVSPLLKTWGAGGETLFWQEIQADKTMPPSSSKLRRRSARLNSRLFLVGVSAREPLEQENRVINQSSTTKSSAVRLMPKATSKNLKSDHAVKVLPRRGFSVNTRQEEVFIARLTEDKPKKRDFRSVPPPKQCVRLYPTGSWRALTENPTQMTTAAIFWASIGQQSRGTSGKPTGTDVNSVIAGNTCMSTIARMKELVKSFGLTYCSFANNAIIAFMEGNKELRGWNNCA